MKLNNVNLILAIIWLVVFIMLVIPQSWCIWVARTITFAFAVMYYKGWKDGKKL